jgi:biotin transport system substrate-specific component
MTETIHAPRLSGMRIARNLTIAVAGAALMTLAAKTQVPFWPVPMTLHVAAVMGFAVLLGPRMATGVFLTYLAVGAVGIPVFSGSPERGMGLAYMMGPTGGYLAGFLLASYLVGTLSTGRRLIGRFGAMLTGLGLVYACGVAWLALYVPANTLFAVGVAPFILGDLVKIAVVAAGATLLSRTRLNTQGHGQ